MLAYSAINDFRCKQNEKFDTIEGPVQPKYQYSLPKEFGDERFPCDFNKKWYLPAAGIPAFELDIYRGKLISIFSWLSLSA